MRELLLSKARLATAAIVALSVLNTGCSTLAASAAGGLADNLSVAILNQDDPETVRDGAPAYLLLLDSFVEGSPDNPNVLSAAANLYASYGAIFADDPIRAARMTSRARRYSERAMCVSYSPSCNWDDVAYDEFEASLKGP